MLMYKSFASKLSSEGFENLRVHRSFRALYSPLHFAWIFKIIVNKSAAFSQIFISGQSVR